MVKIISMFNHKGGVSKTTTCFNLGWSLAQKGYRTLLVDADPQSNLTSLSLSLPDEDSFERLYENKNSNDIFSLATSVMANKVVEGPNSTIIPTAQANLFLLPGNLQIEGFSNQITVALKMAGGIFPETRNYPGLLSFAFKRLADIHNLDFIIIDMAPSLSGLNEVLLMGSDFFIAPCSPDFFSEIAIKNLAKIIPEWHAEIKGFASNYPLSNTPKFLGIIQQKYRPRRKKDSDDRNRPAESFQKWIDRIRKSTNSILVPQLSTLGLAISPEKFREVIADNEAYDIAYISDFNSLVAVSQMENKPVFELTEEDIKSMSNRFGKSMESALNDVQKFKDTFSKLADNILALT
ncbi:MAG: AAA family ATPase [Alphaproteobacteria bacterium]|nr:AAA family ATPase [Alphaproteobacteria bacterium]